jgi:5'-phosphate synthase pdxT subunit
MVKIGILNLQGAVSEHLDMTRKTVENLKLDIEVEEVRYSDDVENVMD